VARGLRVVGVWGEEGGDGTGSVAGVGMKSGFESGLGVGLEAALAGTPRVAVAARPGSAFAAGLLGAWAAGCAAVPVSPGAAAAEVRRAVEVCGVRAMVGAAVDRSGTMATAAGAGVDIPWIEVGKGEVGPPEVPGVADMLEGSAGRYADGKGAAVLFTSGSTGRPKAVVHTHGSLRSQVEALTGAWGIGEEDTVLHCLPVDHIHGLVNALLCPLGVGARVDFLGGGFEAGRVWQRLGEAPRITVFMGVPAMYAKLVRACEGQDGAPGAAGGELRLAVSGSAACPVPVLEGWQRVTGGQIPLERFGMTETGMVLSNPLEASGRRAGLVGQPMGVMECRVVAGDGAGEGASREAKEGELRVRGPQLFSGDLGDPAATTAAFDEQGYFRTGDVVRREELPGGGWYRVLGRASVDILKTGGHKVSALEVEGALLTLEGVREAAVVGIPSPIMGHVIGAAVAVEPGAGLDEGALTEHLRAHISRYKLPKVFRFVDALPRNAMGKVNKRDLLQSLFSSP